MKTQTAEELKSKFLNLYHDFILSDEWENDLQDDLTEIALKHTTTQIEALRERLLNKCKIEDILKKGCGHVLLRSEIDQTINEFLKEINDERI